MIIEKSHRAEARPCANSTMARPFLNQDCVDVIVEYAVESRETILCIRQLSWSFVVGLGNLITRMHRLSGVPLDQLQWEAAAPLATFLNGASRIAFKLTALSASHTARTAVAGGGLSVSPFRWLPRLQTCRILHGTDANLQRALIDVAIHCRQLTRLELVDFNLALVAPALRRMRTVRELVMDVNFQRMAICTVPFVFKPCGASLKRVTLNTTYLLHVPWSSCCPVIEEITLSVANRSDFEELGRCMKLRYLAVTGSHRPQDAVDCLRPLTVRDPPVHIALSHRFSLDAAALPDGYCSLVRSLRCWSEAAGAAWPRLRSLTLSISGSSDESAAQLIANASSNLEHISLTMEGHQSAFGACYSLRREPRRVALGATSDASVGP